MLTATIIIVSTQYNFFMRRVQFIIMIDWSSNTIKRFKKQKLFNSSQFIKFLFLIILFLRLSAFNLLIKYDIFMNSKW